MYQKVTSLLTILILQALFITLTSEQAFAHHPNPTTGQSHLTAQPDAATAQYNITFDATWSTQTHPDDDFPTSNPHFSGLVGATHNDQITFWQEGQLATEGIESMAETGAKAKLLAEVDVAIESGVADQPLSGGGIGLSPGAVSMGPITVNRSHSEITLVSMIAPSPDWFVGVHNLPLIDPNGNWIDDLVIELYPYDSGTDDGSEYKSSNADSVPKEPIKNYTSIAPFSDKPIGTLTITRVRQPAVNIIAPASSLIIEEGTAISLTYQLIDLPANADHVHLYINNVLQGPYYDLTVPIEVTDLPIGTHQLSIDASEVDHTPLNIADSITVNVVAEGSALLPTTMIYLPTILQ